MFENSGRPRPSPVDAHTLAQ